MSVTTWTHTRIHARCSCPCNWISHDFILLLNLFLHYCHFVKLTAISRLTKAQFMYSTTVLSLKVWPSHFTILFLCNWSSSLTQLSLCFQSKFGGQVRKPLFYHYIKYYKWWVREWNQIFVYLVLKLCFLLWSCCKRSNIKGRSWPATCYSTSDAGNCIWT